MLLQRSRTFIQNRACAKSIICSSFKTFFQQTPDFASKIIIDKQLLYPFSQSQTSKALNAFREASPISNNSSNIVLLDKLTATDYSETYRAYNIGNKTFVAQKNIHLGSLASWNQANLLLRKQQFSPPLFAQTLSIEYDEKKQNMKVTSELQKTILKDYSQHLQSHQSIWLKERIKSYVLQIIQQLNALKQLGIELEGKNIDPQKIFIEKMTEQLKLYDLSDFIVKNSASGIDQREFFEIAKRTLMSLNTESRNMTEISAIFKEIEAEIQNLGIEDFQTRISQLNRDIRTNSGYTSESYDQFIFDKLLRVLKEKESANINYSQNKEKSADLLSDLRMVYEKHAKIHKSKGDFKSALECYEKIMEIEENMGQTRERIKSEITDPNMTEQLSSTTDPYIPTSLSGKLAVLIMKVMFFFSTFIIAFIIFGLVAGVCFYGYFHLFNAGTESKQEEKEDKN